MVYSFMTDDGVWPNYMIGAHLRGKAEIRKYWRNQWLMINPTVEPTQIDMEGDGRIALTAHQIVKDLDGKVILWQTIVHVYTFRGMLIRAMKIRSSGTVA